MRESGRSTFTGRDFYGLLVLVLACNLVLWLDSFDRYLSGRYHFYLSQYLPDSAYAPSRRLQQLLALGDEGVPSASAGDAGGADEPEDSAAAAPAQPMLDASAPFPASAVVAAGAPASAPASAIIAASSAPVQAAGIAAASAPPQTGPAVILAATSAPVQASIGAASAPAAAQRKATLALADVAPKILFAGDSMMQGVAPILISRLRRAYPQGVFVDASKESTGLTVNRYFDWPTKIREECLKQGLRTLVIFLGPNDPWDIYEHRKRYVFPSDKWEQKYRSRVDEVLDFAVSQGLRVIWVGLPVMREDRIAQGAKIENRIFREETGKYKFEYVSTEDLMGSVDQPYQKYIDDPKKGKVVVRADDGVHFTSAGLRMISSKIEQLLRKQDKL